METKKINNNLLEKGICFEAIKEMTTTEILNLMNQFKGVLKE
jgi:hypothetical protein